MIDLVLIHGWGLSHHMWDKFTDSLFALDVLSKHESFNNSLSHNVKIPDNIKIHYLSPYDNTNDSIKNFTKEYRKDNNKLVIMGHSLGGLKMLSSDLLNLSDAIILVNSFAKFTKSADFEHGINPKILSMMIKKLQKDPKSVLLDFLSQNNILKHLSNTDYMDNMDTSNLLQGLEDLKNLDCLNTIESNNIYNIYGDCDPLLNINMYDHMNSHDSIHAISYHKGEHFIPHTHAKELASDVTKIINSISNNIVSNFNNKSISYDNNAQIQELISNKLIHYLNNNKSIENNTINRVLELGCGTGLFTRQLVENFPHAHVISTDLSFNMLKQNQLRLSHMNKQKNVKFAQLNALTEVDNFMDHEFDLICSSMLFQWFEDPLAILKLWQAKLKPEGIFAISLLGDKSFDNINTYIHDHNFNKIFNEYPPLEYFKNHGIDIYEDDCYFDYDSLKALLKTMINTGANHNKHDKQSNNELKILLKEFNSTITIKWNSIFLIGKFN